MLCYVTIRPNWFDTSFKTAQKTYCVLETWCHICSTRIRTRTWTWVNFCWTRTHLSSTRTWPSWNRVIIQVHIESLYVMLHFRITSAEATLSWYWTCYLYSHIRWWTVSTCYINFNIAVSWTRTWTQTWTRTRQQWTRTRLSRTRIWI